MRSIFLIVCMCCSLITLAQSNFKVSGIVIGVDKEPIIGATANTSVLFFSRHQRIQVGFCIGHCYFLGLYNNSLGINPEILLLDSIFRSLNK